MIIEGEDGITHINIYSKGKTELGRWLSNFAYSPFILEIEEEHHQFASIEGLWYWYTTGQDVLKDMYGHQAKIRGKKYDKLRDIDSELICRALDEKLKNHPTVMKDFAYTRLPLCHYYEYDGKKVDAGYEWIVEHLEKRRKQLREYYG